MWREIIALNKKYYEGNNKYITKVYRNRTNNCEMSIVEAYSDSQPAFMIYLYPLTDNKYIVRNFGPTVVKFKPANKEESKNITEYIKKTINSSPPNFKDLYDSPYSESILRE